jgi:chromosome segregation ATPase
MRNLNKPPRYNVASIQAQQTLGGDVMQSDENGQYVEFRDYAWLLSEKQRLDNNCNYLDQKLDEELEKSAMLCGQVERLEHQVNYWRIEAETDNARWLRCLEDNERLRKELADAQENYHIVNEMVAKMLKEGKQS